MKIYNRSSLDGMVEIVTNSIDLILTSPPYWDLKDYGDNKQLGLGLTYETYLKFLYNNILACSRVLKSDAFCVFNVADIRRNLRGDKNDRPRVYSIQSYLIREFEKLGLELFSHIIWEKNSVKKGEKGKIIHGSVDKDYIYPPYVYNDLSIEHILVFRKPGVKRELPKLIHRKDKFLKNEVQDFYNPVWKLNESTNDKNHPAAFPKELASRIVKMYSLKGDVVLDPFVGSGTTLEEATKLGRATIGYELNLSYLDEIISKYKLVEISDREYSDDV